MAKTQRQNTTTSGTTGQSGSGSLELHNKIVNETLLLLGQQSFCRVWRNETGQAIKLSTYYNAKSKNLPLEALAMGFFRYGCVGSSDIMGIVQGGRLLCVEIKSGNARQSKVQKNFEKMIQRFGGIYVLARTAEEALNKVTHCLDS